MSFDAASIGSNGEFFFLLFRGVVAFEVNFFRRV